MKPTQEQLAEWVQTAKNLTAALTVAYEAGYEAGRKDENEACAKVCEGLRDEDGYEAWGIECAAAIRARREQ